MELEFFCKPGTDLEWFAYWKQFCINWLQSSGHQRGRDARSATILQRSSASTAKATTDIEFLFPFGWGELWGIADRTDYDLTQHQNVSGQDMSYFDDEVPTKNTFLMCIEPSLGADRVTLAFLCDAYDEEELEGGDVRTVMHFHPALAPVKVGVLPLVQEAQRGRWKGICRPCAKNGTANMTTAGNIGKRYRRQDEIGTPFCVTYDFDSETDGAVTVRDRDTMEQERVKIEDLVPISRRKWNFNLTLL